MTPQESIVDELRAILHAIAPDADVASVAIERDLREALDLDSMDFLAFATTVGKRFGIAITAAESRELATLAGARAFVERARAA
jgi:acyl carrier protein